MQPSPEIRDAVLRAFQQLAAKDLAGMMANVSNEPGILFIGTAPTEWAADRAAIEQLTRATMESGGGGGAGNMEVEGYQEGTVGWASQRASLPLPNGVTLTLRGTYIFHQEGGQWKLVQGHYSVGIPDDQVMNIK